MRPTFFFAVFAALVGSPLARALAADPDPARPADAFVDFVGVNTHLGYYDTAYGDYEHILKPRLLELGVRHIRDGTFWLALFQEAGSYDQKTQRDLEVPPVTVNLSLPWTASEIVVFRPNVSSEPKQRITQAGEIKLAVPDEVLLIEIRPATK